MKKAKKRRGKEVPAPPVLTETVKRSRRLWIYACRNPFGTCKNPMRRQTFFKAVAIAGLCRKCRKGIDFNPNQTTIFDEQKIRQNLSQAGEAIENVIDGHE